MTLQNLIDYCKEFELEDIFSGVLVPEPLDPEEVKSAIMVRCGLLTPVYSEPSTMRSMLKFWFTSHIWNIEHLIKIILAEYSPIENYDRYEDIKTDRKNKESASGSDIESGTNNTTNNASDTLSGSDSFSHGENIESQVSAFNTSDYSNNDKEIHSGDDVTQYGKTNTHSHTDNNTHSNTNTYGKVIDNVGDEHVVSHIHGNIGVKTSEEVINEELELLKNFNVYDWIASQVENDLFLTIY